MTVSIIYYQEPYCKILDAKCEPGQYGVCPPISGAIIPCCKSMVKRENMEVEGEGLLK